MQLTIVLPTPPCSWQAPPSRHHQLIPELRHDPDRIRVEAVIDGGHVLRANHGAVTLTKSSLSGNSATGNGGGLANADTPSGTAPAATFTNSPVSNNTAGDSGGGIYNDLRGSLTTSGVSGSPLFITGNAAALNGGGIATLDSTATSLTQTAVNTNHADQTSGGVYRKNGTMTTTNSPISANTTNNCVGCSAPAVPNLKRPGFAGDSVSWEGWGHVEAVEQLP